MLFKCKHAPIIRGIISFLFNSRRLLHLPLGNCSPVRTVTTCPLTPNFHTLVTTNSPTMSYECWMRFAGMDAVKFPKNLCDFEGYMIASMVVDTVIKGGRDLHPGRGVIMKGNLPSLHPAFIYHLRFKYNAPKAGSKYNEGDSEYEILPKVGLRGCKRIPWRLATLNWSIQNEINMEIAPVKSAVTAALGLICPPSTDPEREIPEATLRDHIFYADLRKKSDYYRTGGMMIIRRGWPGEISKIRKMEAKKIADLSEHLQTSPHELCFYGHSKHYELGEMSVSVLADMVSEARILDTDNNKVTTKPIHMAATAFYAHLKELRGRWGHTLFRMAEVMRNFPRNNTQYGHMAEAAMHWLVREGHLLFLDERAECISERSLWFASPSPIVYLQFPRDDQLKERIVAHLQRIVKNFLENRGQFTLRPPEALLPAVPGGPLNERQRLAMDHILNNPITIIQGGPGSGKTFEGVDHLVSLFHWPEIVTHVGRQAVALCDRLGGCTEIATTIHGAHFSRQNNPMRVLYADKKEILIMDEVYNADDWTFEKALALAPNASRLVMVGDPDQIRPIPDEKGAGTPALDIARVFSNHVIFLNENMRQLAEARAIHDVVTAVRTKQPRAIKWSGALDAGPAVLLKPRPDLGEMFNEVIARLRSDTKGDDHAWQIVTFFNGFKPDTQGIGVNQLNDFVEVYLDRTGFFKQKVHGKMRTRHKITNRLTMYVGMKFMITEKFTPDPSLNGGKKGRSAEYLAKKARRVSLGKRGAVAVQKEPEYTETRNGQIEVVASIKEERVKGARHSSWVIECVPKGKCVRGAKIMINRQLHVDPSHIVPAWAVTTNKSMGGECRNVAVYIPPRIDASMFDRSNLYVAVSRPTHFLCVVGEMNGIECLTMRDPKVIDSGLLTRLKQCECTIDTDDGEKVAVQWREAHDVQQFGSVLPAIPQLLNIYDQSKRKASREMIPACPVSYKQFRVAFRLDPTNKSVDLKMVMRLHQMRLYDHVRNNVKEFLPWKAVPDPDDIPSRPPSPERFSDDDEDDVDGGESETKRARVDGEDQEPGRAIGDVGDWIESE